MANEATVIFGTEIVLEATGTSTSIGDGSYYECNDDDLQTADVAAYPLGRFEFDTETTGFSAAPTAGYTLALYEQRINSDGSDSPDVDANNQHTYLGSFQVDTAETGQQFLVLNGVPLNQTGGKYWLYWEDGGAGTATIDAGWEFRVTPYTYGTA